MPFDYDVYGLRLVSNRAISGLSPAPNLAQSASPPQQQGQLTPTEWAGLVVEFVDSPERKLERVGDWQSAPRVGLENGPSLEERAAHTEQGTYLWLRYSDGKEWADFFVGPEGRHIWIYQSVKAPFQDIVAILIGPVLGRVLRLRGELCLHANSLQLSGQAFALLGAKASGKSTTTAALFKAGCGVMADDISVLRPSGSEFLVCPGHPALRLCNDAAEELFDATQLHAIWSGQDYRPQKRYLRLNKQPEAFATAPAPLVAIYMLEARESERTAVAIEPMAPQQALVSLVTHTFANHFLDARQRANEFTILGQVVRQVPIRRVKRPDNLSLLPQLAQAIMHDVQALNSSH